MCLFLILLFLGPRSAIVVWWLAQPSRWELTYDSFLLPFLGFLIAPWTTLAFVVVDPFGVDGLDYLLLGLAVLADLASLSGEGVHARRRQTAPAGVSY